MKMILAILTYIDPGTGSIILQALFATVIGALVAVRLFWHRILRFFRLRNEVPSDSSDLSDNAPQGHDQGGVKKLPLITIITPALNASLTIGHIIGNVISQKYSNIEHIIIDGGSTDSTPMVIKEYMDRYEHIRLIEEPDQGLYDAMNKGIKHSNGDYLIFLGCDDQFHDDDVLMNMADSGLLDGKHVVYGNAKIVGNTGWAKNGDVYDGKFSLKKLIRQNICHQAIFYPGEIFSVIGLYNLNYKINADWDLNWRSWVKTEFVYADRIVCTFSAGGHSTGSTDHAFKADYMNNIRKYFRFDPKTVLDYGRHSPWGDLTSTHQIDSRFDLFVKKFRQSIGKIISP
jgi:glycosyltransferase involved in cell wall biosynthesis